MEPFVPLVRNPHLLTLAGNFWPRRFDQGDYPVSAKLYETEPGVQVLVHSQRPRGAATGEIILVHGLEGSSEAGYARSLAHAALERGYAVHRYNMRSCGGTEALSGPTLYHSGQTGDLLAVARAIAREAGAVVYPVGFSLGGNVVLKLAGELGDAASEFIGAIAAVSAPIDLAACSRRLQHPGNIVYAWRFLNRLKRRIRLKHQLTPGLFPMDRLKEATSVYRFDDLFTAPSFGFGTADNYYATQSSNRFLDRIRVPCMVVQAKDDPLIPFSVFDHPAFRQNPNLRLVAVEHGGHLGFLSRNKPRFWVDGLVLGWLAEVGNKLPAGSVH